MCRHVEHHNERLLRSSASTPPTVRARRLICINNAFLSCR